MVEPPPRWVFITRQKVSLPHGAVVIPHESVRKIPAAIDLLTRKEKVILDMARARDFNWLFTNRKIPPHANQHVQDQYFEFIDALGVPHGEPQWTFGPWNDEERAWQRQVGHLGGVELERDDVAVAVVRARSERIRAHRGIDERQQRGRDFGASRERREAVEVPPFFIGHTVAPAIGVLGKPWLKAASIS